MKFSPKLLLSLLLILPASLWAQQSGDQIEIDYNNPKKYVVGGVSVEGNTTYYIFIWIVVIYFYLVT